VGRRPGTAPLRYRSAPQNAGVRRQRADSVIASGLFSAMVVLSLLCWGPIPIGCLWLGSRAQYVSGSVTVGIVASFGSAGVALCGSLMVLQRLDHAWVLARRASGRDQRSGALARIFAATAMICVVVFSVWFLVILGPNDPNL
jgi:predicted secreted protein